MGPLKEEEEQITSVTQARQKKGLLKETCPQKPSSVYTYKSLICNSRHRHVCERLDSPVGGAIMKAFQNFGWWATAERSRPAGSPWGMLSLNPSW